MIKDITNSILEKIIEQVKTPENIKKIQLILLDPLIDYTYNKIYPYCMLIIIIFMLTFILAILILIILIKKIV
jgi:hypothetical protein